MFFVKLDEFSLQSHEKHRNRKIDTFVFLAISSASIKLQTLDKGYFEKIAKNNVGGKFEYAAFLKSFTPKHVFLQ